MSCGNPGKNGRLAVLRSATISINPTEDPCSPGAATQRHTTYDNPGQGGSAPLFPQTTIHIIKLKHQSDSMYGQ